MQKSFKAGALSAENMQSHQWLVYKKDDPILVKLCTLHKIPISSLRFKLVAPSWPLLQRAALRGDGVALLPSEYVENESRLKIVMKLAEEYGLHYHLLYPKELSKQKNLQNFIATLLA
jgi:DNA-binding transcriptional LysR family regulator